jgi:hypothetical protein
MLAALINSPRTASPSLTVAVSAAGVLGATARPSVASFSFTASVVSTFTIASLRRVMSGAGVPAGAKNATHDDISKPGTVSPMVETSGIAA